MYRAIGLDLPDVVWTMSPKAGFERVSELRGRRSKALRANTVAFLASGHAGDVCFCGTCSRGRSVCGALHRTAPSPRVQVHARSGTQASTLVTEALSRFHGMEVHEASTVSWQAPRGIAGRPFCNPWLTVEEMVVAGERRLETPGTDNRVDPRSGRTGQSLARPRRRGRLVVAIPRLRGDLGTS